MKKTQSLPWLASSDPDRSFLGSFKTPKFEIPQPDRNLECFTGIMRGDDYGGMHAYLSEISWDMVSLFHIQNA